MDYSSARTAARFGGAAVIGSLFLPWYGLDLTAPGADVTGWQIMRSADVALATLGALAIIQLRIGGAVLMGWLFAAAGVLSAVFVVLRIVDPPFGLLAQSGLDIKLLPGAFVACAGSVLIAYAGSTQARRGSNLVTYDAYAPVTGHPATAGGPGVRPDPFAVQR